MNTKEISFLLLFKMSKNCIAVEMDVINVNNNLYRQSSKQFFITPRQYLNYAHQ